ncbi:MAG: DUF2723 domain-containing protein [Chloroflexi bacterium]|nr:DUF2723 domain-containing protein [Chloroflexota bacterium]
MGEHSPAAPPGRTGGLPLSRLDAFIALLVGITAGAVYLRTLAPTILVADGGEFQFAAYLGGIAHPTGYPLYLVLGWLWSHLLPWGDVAFRMNLFSAWWAALAVAAVYLLSVCLLRVVNLLGRAPRLASVVAALGALTLAFSYVFWTQAVVAEVYALHALFTAAALLAALGWRCGQGSQRLRWALWLALLLGLSLTHHRTTLLLFPGLLLFVFLCLRRRPLPKPHPSFYVQLLLCLFLPQALYLYIPLRAPTTPYLRLPWDAAGDLVLYANTLRGFLDFVAGRVFAAELRLAPESWERLQATVVLLRQQFDWWGLALGALGLVLLLVRRQGALAALTTLVFFGQVAFNSVYHIGDIEVFFLPSYLVFALWIGLGMAGLVDGMLYLLARGGRPLDFQWLGSLVLLPLVALPTALVWRNLPLVDLSQDLSARSGWEQFLQADPPQNALVASNDRNEIMPLWYLQYVEGQRSDLTGVFPLITPEPRFGNVGRLLRAALGTGRPVVLPKAMPGLEVAFQIQPEEGYWRVRSAVGPPAAAQVHGGALGGALRLAAFALEPAAAPAAGSSLEVTLWWEPTAALPGDYTTFVHLEDANGQRLLGSDHQPGGSYYPTSLWETGDTLEDRHVLHLPHDLPAGTYRLRVGAYLYPQMTALGEPLVLGEMAVR